MNFKTICASLLASSLLLACGKDSEPVQPAATTAEGFTLEMTADLTAGGLKAIDFDLSHDGIKIKQQESNFSTHAFFRKKGTNQTAYARLEWRILRQQDGSVKLELKNGQPSQLNLRLVEGSGSVALDNSGHWYVAGVAGGGKLSADGRSVSFGSDLALADNHLNAPLAFRWTRIQGPINVFFAPQGVILRPHVKNSTNYDLPRMQGYVVTNAIDNDGHFDFSSSKNDNASLEDGLYAGWLFTKPNAPATDLAELSFRVSLAPKATGRALVWGMSRGRGQSESKTQAAMGDKPLSREGSNQAFVSSVMLRDGQSKYLPLEAKAENLEVYGGDSPFARVAVGLVNKAENGFTRTHTTEMGYFTWQQAAERFFSKTINGSNYYLPSKEEMMLLFPLQAPASAKPEEVLTFNRPTASTRSWDESVKFSQGEEAKTYRSTYRNVPGKAQTVGIRFDGHGNAQRMAYRYTLTPKGLQIDAIKIGSQALTVEQIDKDAWWANQPYSSVLLPVTGWQHPGTTNMGGLDALDGRFWTVNTETADQANAWAGIFGQNLGFSNQPREAGFVYPALLFKKPSTGGIFDNVTGEISTDPEDDGDDFNWKPVDPE